MQVDKQKVNKSLQVSKIRIGTGWGCNLIETDATQIAIFYSLREERRVLAVALRGRQGSSYRCVCRVYNLLLGEHLAFALTLCL